MAYKNKVCGIYMLTCDINGKRYIGQSCNVYQRKNLHKYDAFKLSDETAELDEVSK